VRQQNPYIAKLEVLAVAAEWARTDRDGFLPVAVLREHRANGEPRRQEIAEVYTRKDYRILAGVTKIEVCLEFYRRGPEAAAEPRKVGATTWQAIGPIEPGDVYDVRINLNKQSLEKLQAASR
jgi:hypothetical protein